MMTEKQLQNLIAEKEAELKALKQQLKEMQQAKKETKQAQTTEVLTYNEVSKLDNYREYLNTLDKKAINKIARQGSIRYTVTANELADIIEKRTHKGEAFR